MPGRRYPRPGHRLAPRTLAEVLRKPLPPEYSSLASGAPARLCDLDETAWDHFDERTCRCLASEVVRLVGRAARQPAAFTGRAVPPIPSGVSLADLELDSRTYNCLVAAGIEDRPQDLGRMTIEGLLSLQGFWGKCLVDLLTSIEHCADHPESARAVAVRRSTSMRSAKTLAAISPRLSIGPGALPRLLNVPVPRDRIKNRQSRGPVCATGREISAATV